MKLRHLVTADSLSLVCAMGSALFDRNPMGPLLSSAQAAGGKAGSVPDVLFAAANPMKLIRSE